MGCHLRRRKSTFSLEVFVLLHAVSACIKWASQGLLGGYYFLFKKARETIPKLIHQLALSGLFDRYSFEYLRSVRLRVSRI